MIPMKDKVLLIDIPVYKKEISGPYRRLLSLSIKAENLLQNRHIDATRGYNMYSRGLLSIASYLTLRGIKVEYVSYNDNDLNIIDKLKEIQIVGITCVTPTINKALYICNLVKKFDREIICVLGGPHVSHLDVDTFQSSLDVDIIVRGEGELTLFEIINNLDNLNSVKGITYRKGDTVYVNEGSNPLDRLIAIDYGFLPGPLNSYAHNIMTTRGCPNACKFCADNIFQGTKSYSVDEIIEELHFLNERLNSGTIVHFCDSNFLLKRDLNQELLRRMKDEEFDLFFSCDARTDFVTTEIIRNMEKANFIQINLGLEDLDDSVLNFMDKKLDFEFNMNVCRTIHRNTNLMIKAYMIAGLPGSSHQTAHNNIIRLKHLFDQDLADFVGMKMYIPYPGTDIFNNPDKFGLSIQTKEWDKYDRFSFPVYRLESLNQFELFFYFYEMEAVILRGYCNKLGLTIEEIEAIPNNEDDLNYIYQQYARICHEIN